MAGVAFLTMVACRWWGSVFSFRLFWVFPLSLGMVCLFWDVFCWVCRSVSRSFGVPFVLRVGYFFCAVGVMQALVVECLKIRFFCLVWPLLGGGALGETMSGC